MVPKSTARADALGKDRERDKKKSKSDSSRKRERSHPSSKKKKQDKDKTQKDASKSKVRKDDEPQPPKKKKKRVSFRDPLEHTESEVSTDARHTSHKVISATIVDISDMLLNEACQVEINDDPVFSINGGWARPCCKGVRAFSQTFIIMLDYHME